VKRMRVEQEIPEQVSRARAGAEAVLAEAIGTHQDRPALPALASHFARVWFNRIHPGYLRAAAVVPDGCTDLQWITGRLRIAGPDRTATIEHLAEGVTVIGLRFQPGAAAAWLGVPASELVNQRVPLEAFWGRDAIALADWVSEAETTDGIARRLESGLSKRV